MILIGSEDRNIGQQAVHVTSNRKAGHAGTNYKQTQTHYTLDTKKNHTKLVSQARGSVIAAA